MTLNEHISLLVNQKIQSLECANREQKLQIEELKRKNAVLHIRLAKALHAAQIHRETRDKLQSDMLHNQDFKKKLEFVKSDVKKFKEEFTNLSADVKLMFDNYDRSFEFFTYNVAKKMRTAEEHVEFVEDLNLEIQDLKQSLQKAHDLYAKEKTRRRELHNALVQARGNIRVHCRVRPLLNLDLEDSTHDDESHSDILITEESHNKNSILLSDRKIVHAIDDEVVSVCTSPQKPNRCFEYEKVYSPSDDQCSVFNEVEPLLTSFLDGYNVCVMAYGQTGSGKSYTMLGTPDQPGIVPRTAELLFRLISEKSDSLITLEVSVAEVYNNDIFDLLVDEPKRAKHGIVTTEEGGKDVPTLTHVTVKSAADILSLMEHGLSHRARISTKVHEHSSRSHLVVGVTATFHQIASRQSPFPSGMSCHSEPNTPRKSSSNIEPEVGKTTVEGRIRRQLPQPQPSRFARNITSSPLPSSSVSVPSSPLCLPTSSSFKTKLQLVDLAGSECVGMSGVTGSALRESSYINRSLSALSDVLSALSENRSHIPYRNSRLTHLLQDSIGGDAKMLVLLCVSPGRRFVTETLQCLGFGNRARQVIRGRTKRKGHVTRLSCRSPAKVVSPRLAHSPTHNVVRRILN